MDRDARGRELADESRRAARSVRSELGSQRNSRRDDVNGRNQVLPKDASGDLRTLAAGLVEKDADIAIVVVVNAAIGAEGWRSRLLMSGR
jgi:hypothetical protein